MLQYNKFKHFSDGLKLNNQDYFYNLNIIDIFNVTEWLVQKFEAIFYWLVWSLYYIFMGLIAFFVSFSLEICLMSLFMVSVNIFFIIMPCHKN